jgi:hypothetical protein
MASVAGAMLAICMLTLPAYAQATRTWVSGVGDDANPCSRTAPCKTFAGAISKTAAFGEINCLDPGGFGAVTITKSIIISCEAGTAGILVSGTNGIVVAVAPSDIVYLRGLDIEGLTTGLAGINFIQSGALHVEHCRIRGFNSGTAAGINFAPTGAGELFVSESYLTDNGTGNVGAGVLIRPTGTGSANVVLSQLHVENNALGIKIDSLAGTGFVHLSITDSVAAGNTNAGIAAFTTAGQGSANVLINRTTSSNNAVGVRSNGPTSVVRIGSSAITGNVLGIAISGGVLQSYGNNQITLNNTDGTPTATIPLN